MQRASFAEMNCSVAQSLEAVGEWWTLLIIRDALLGITRFDEFSARLGISRNILTQRLETLVAQDILVKQAYQHNPVRYDYRLTEKGRDLWGVIDALRQWGDCWTTDEPPVVIRHLGCGHIVDVVPTCPECGEVVRVDAVRAERGPGASDRNPLPIADH